jgi:ribosomal protein L37E
VKNGEVTFFVLLGLLFALGSLRDVVKAAQAKRCGRCGSDSTFNADDGYQCAECGAQLATALLDAHWRHRHKGKRVASPSEALIHLDGGNAGPVAGYGRFERL